MTPKQCAACQGRDLYQMYVANNSAFLRHGLFNEVFIHFSVCLTCGAIAQYLDSESLEKVRLWRAKDRTRETKENESAPDG